MKQECVIHNTDSFFSVQFSFLMETVVIVLLAGNQVF
jgi:hypothetical protein